MDNDFAGVQRMDEPKRRNRIQAAPWDKMSRLGNSDMRRTVQRGASRQNTRKAGAI